MTNPTPHMYPGVPRRAGIWSRLTPIQRVGALAVALLLPCCGGLALIGALGDDEKPRTQPLAEQVAGEAVQATPPAPTEEAETPPAPTEEAETPAAPTEKAQTEAAETPAESAEPVTTTVTERQAIPFATRTVKDSSLAKGKTKVRTKGVNGVKTLTYEVTGGDRKLIRTAVTRKPVTKVVAVGTKTAPSGGGDCHASYEPCVPIASDVDCAGGSGDGPAYVDGPIRVVGPDEYRLDRDGDKVACD